MRWWLLACVACGTPSDSSSGPATAPSSAPLTPAKSTVAFPTSKSICDAFPVEQIDGITQLAATEAQPGDDARPRCTYSKKDDPATPSVVIQIRMSPSLDPIKRTFKDGRTIPGVGDEAWFYHSPSNSGALYVQKGALQLMLQATDTGKTFDEARELAVTSGLAKIVLAKL